MLFSDTALDLERFCRKQGPKASFGDVRRSERPRVQPIGKGTAATEAELDQAERDGAPGNWTPVQRRVPQSPKKPKSKKGKGGFKYVKPGSREDIEDDPVVAAVAHATGEPATFKQALRSAAKDAWIKAMEAELHGLIENGTWEIVDLPDGRIAIRNKWVYKVKMNENGEVERHKARLVVRGDTQKAGEDYQETFAPVARLESWRYLIALAAHLGWEIHQIDFDQAYLNGELDEEIYMEQPEGFKVGEAGKVCRLRKALYGLKQAGRQWFLTLKTCLEDIGFECHDTGDISVFVNRQGEEEQILVVYVDDLTMMGSSLATINRTKEALKGKFALKDLGELRHYLGIRVTRDRGSHQIFLDQEAYILALLKRYQYHNCNPKKTPLPSGAVLEENTDRPEDCPPERLFEYRSLLGSLMYATLGTRPDIAFAVAKLCQYHSWTTCPTSSTPSSRSRSPPTSTTMRFTQVSSTTRNISRTPLSQLLGHTTERATIARPGRTSPVPSVNARVTRNRNATRNATHLRWQRRRLRRKRTKGRARKRRNPDNRRLAHLYLVLLSQLRVTNLTPRFQQ